MATRSMIFCQVAKNEYVGSYCHWDGYIEHVGMTLMKNYNTQEKLINLINHGSMSSIGVTIEDCVFHDKENPEIEIVKTLKQVKEYFDLCCAEFIYVKKLDGDLIAYEQPYGGKTKQHNLTKLMAQDFKMKYKDIIGQEVNLGDVCVLVRYNGQYPYKTHVIITKFCKTSIRCVTDSGETLYAYLNSITKVPYEMYSQIKDYDLKYLYKLVCSNGMNPSDALVKELTKRYIMTELVIWRMNKFGLNNKKSNEGEQ